MPNKYLLDEHFVDQINATMKGVMNIKASSVSDEMKINANIIGKYYEGGWKFTSQHVL